MTTVYACVGMEASYEAYDYRHGCLPETRRTLSVETLNVTAGTLPELLQKLRAKYGLELDDLWYPEDENQDADSCRVGFNRLETEDGAVPTEREKDRWRRRQLKFYLADYDFRLEKRQLSGIPLVEFHAAEITTHD